LPLQAGTDLSADGLQSHPMNTGTPERKTSPWWSSTKGGPPGPGPVPANWTKQRPSPTAHAAHAAPTMWASVGSPLASTMRHTPGKFARGGYYGHQPGDHGAGKVFADGKALRQSAHSASGSQLPISPLPINDEVLQRINALGPEMQPMQKYILLVGIVLDFYSKAMLVRELSRFAYHDVWTWFSMVFIFWTLSGCCTTAYWLLHYPMPSAADIEKEGMSAPRVYGFSKLYFKRVVRNAGALCAMCQLGTAFAAWRALRTNDLRQRKAEMDLRGMQLVDTVFLTLPVATLQAYIGMACSSPDVICPGRSGFDIIVGWLAVVGCRNFKPVFKAPGCSD